MARTIPQLLGTIREGANNIPQLGAQTLTVVAIDSLAVEINDLVEALRWLADSADDCPALDNARAVLARLDAPATPPAPVEVTPDTLADELIAWCEEQGIPVDDADALILDPFLTTEQRQWLTRFILRWEKVCNEQDGA